MRYDKVRCVKAGQGWHGLVRLGLARNGKVRQGLAGLVWCGWVVRVVVWYGRLGKARFGTARLGEVRHGLAG